MSHDRGQSPCYIGIAMTLIPPITLSSFSFNLLTLSYAEQQSTSIVLAIPGQNIILIIAKVVDEIAPCRGYSLATYTRVGLLSDRIETRFDQRRSRTSMAR